MLVLGTAQLRAAYGVVRRRRERAAELDALEVLASAVELGVEAFDTAPSYDDAEELIGASGAPVGIHTKFDPALDPAVSIARSLERLQRRSVEIAYFHDHSIVTDDPHRWIERATTLVGSEVARLGVSVYDAEELRAAVARECFGAVQLPMNVLDRRISVAEINSARAHGLAIYARSPFLQGVLLADPRALPSHLEALAPSVARIRDLAHSNGLTPMHLALAWLRDVPGVDGVVVGAEDVTQLRELTHAWAQPPLPPEVLDGIEQQPRPHDDLLDPRRW